MQGHKYYELGTVGEELRLSTTFSSGITASLLDHQNVLRLLV